MYIVYLPNKRPKNKDDAMNPAYFPKNKHSNNMLYSKFTCVCVCVCVRVRDQPMSSSLTCGKRNSIMNGRKGNNIVSE